MINKIVIILALPFVVFWGGAWIMAELSNRDYVINRLNESNLSPCEKKPLNQRLGYNLNAAVRYWEILDPTARKTEQYFLKLDLVFPFFYGAALAISLLLTWAILGRPFRPLWIITPVAVLVLADWTENLVQLHQLKKYREHGEAALQPYMIQIASIATCIKLTFFCALTLFLIGLVIIVLVRSPRLASKK